MPVRTYIPALLFIAKHMCRYIRRYQDQINARLTSDGRVALAAVLTACEVLEPFLEGAITPPSE